ncbi:MAG: FHA domain-containing protein, partial [Planctomycetes bacterium]|nr:FHA domain-containing protein [Planctomycetota bacterium]
MGRCTLGSSRQCQIYLPDDQVRPLHCLIVHNADKTLVTRWAPGVLLNGKDFSTAPFQPGDQLTIGNIEFQLVADDTQRPPTDQQGATPTVPMEVAPTPLPSVEQERPVSPPQPVVMPTEKSAEKLAGVVSPRGERDRKVRRLWLANFNARSRCRQLIGSMRELRTQSADFDQQIGGLHRQLHLALDERQQLAGELEQRQAEIVERDQRAATEMDRLISELSAACEKANASESAASEQALAGERLREEIATLASQHEQIELAQAQDEQNRILLSQELADRDLKIEQLQRQLEQSEASKIFSAKQSGELADTVERLQAELDRERTERNQIAAEQASLGNQLRELEQNLAHREHTIDALHQQLEQSEESGNANAKRSGELAGRVERLQAELDREQTEREELADEQAALGNQLRELEQNLADREHTIDDLRQQLEQSEESGNVNAERSAELADTVERLQYELDQQRTEREGLAAEQAALGNQLRGLEQNLADRESTIGALHQQLE